MASCSSCTSGPAQAYQQTQQAVQQQFQSKSLAQHVKEAAEPQTQESSSLNTTGDRGRTLNVTA